jgi:hypothetical protein
VLIGAAVIGVVMSNNGLQTAGDLGGSGGRKAAESGGADDSAGQPSPAARSLAITDASDFGTVVVARAGDARGSTQTYTVERILKGSAPANVKLETEVDGRLARGSLALLFLDPRTDASPCPTPQVFSESGAASPAPAADETSPSADATSGGSRDASKLYLYNGQCAVVLTIPEDLSAADIQIE